MLLTLLFVLFVLLLLRSRWQRRDLFKLAAQIKCSYRSLPFIGHSYLFIGGEEHRMKSLQLLGKDAIKQGGTVSFWHASELFIFVADPVVAEILLNNCLEKADVVKLTRPLVGNGSIFAPVSIWRPRRKVLAPTFSTKNLVKFMDIFVRQSHIMVENMRKKASEGIFSIWDIVSAFTMDSVCETTLGIKLDAQNINDRPFLKAMDSLNKIAALRLCRPWLHSDFIFTKTSHWTTAMKEKTVVYDFINKVIKEKREASMANQQSESELTSSDVSEGCLKTFLEMLMQSSNDNGYTNVELQEEILVIVMAGTDSAAVAIAFTILLLCRHPDIQEKVYLELEEIFGDSDWRVESHNLSKLVYLEAVIKEALRLYPPAPVIVRKVEKNIELPTGVTLIQGCSIVIHIWALHRNPEYWGDDADQYRPERFINTKLKHPAAFIPFSYGTRGCLGYQYAMMSMKTALATLLRQYRVLPPSSSCSKAGELRVKFDIMTRHAGEYLIQLERRN